MRRMRVLGLMSGTSMDGIDAALVEICLMAESSVALRLIHSEEVSFSPNLHENLLRSLPPAGISIGDVCKLHTRIGQEFARIAARIRCTYGPIDLVCSHGQTMYHWVLNGATRGSLQLGEAAWIAAGAKAPVVSDLRMADIVAGGAGAPLVAFLDALLLAGYPHAAALNLGGIANITVLGTPLVAFDIGPANALIDAVVRTHIPNGPGFDRDGILAATGSVDGEWLAELLREPYYQRDAPKTTGKELFTKDYVERSCPQELSIEDQVATLTELTAVTVAEQLRQYAVEFLAVSGGGIRNPTLMHRIQELAMHTRVVPSDTIGIPADSKEAILCALIGWCTWNGIPSGVPEATGAVSPRILGSITPWGAIQLPSPGPEITELHVSEPCSHS